MDNEPVDKKILILGAAGMLGHMIASKLSENPKFEVVGTARNPKNQVGIIPLNIDDLKKTEELLDVYAPDIIINCTAVLVQESEENQSNAIYVNSLFPKILERRFEKSATKIIHFSTPGVFLGERGKYTINDPTDANTFYGKTKALGEVHNDKDLTIRSDFWGPDLQKGGGGLFNWCMQQDGKIQGHMQRFFNGVSSVECATFLVDAINHDLCGLFHLTANEMISKGDFLKKVKQIMAFDDLTIEENREQSSDFSIIKTDCDFYEGRSYDGMLEDVRSWIECHKESYLHYVNRGVK